jgi:hypothetical protein
MTRIALCIYIVVFMLCMASVHAQDYYTTDQLPQVSATARNMNSNMPLQNGTVITPQLIVPNTGTVAIPSTSDTSASPAVEVPNSNVNVGVMPSTGGSRPVTGAIITPLVMPTPQPTGPIVNWQFHADGSATKVTSWPGGGISTEEYDASRAPRGIVHNAN